jgi:hypothetical protein
MPGVKVTIKKRKKKGLCSRFETCGLGQLTRNLQFQSKSFAELIFSLDLQPEKTLVP